jgi:hypothetical protein
MKKAVFCLGLLTGATIASVAFNIQTMTPKQSDHCLYGEYETLEQYNDTDKPERAWVKMNGKRVEVYVECRGSKRGSSEPYF